MTQRITLFMALVALLFGPAVAGCGKKAASSKPSNVDYYTCTMHPSVKSQDPKGKCPICGMDLVPVMKKGGGETKPAASPQMQATRSRGEKQPGQMQGMEGMPGMPGTKPEAATQGAQTREFVVPVERQ